MVTFKDVSKWYGTTQVLYSCSTEIRRGQVVVVCGPSGSGKSTLIKCVNRLEDFQKGTIVVDGISVGDSRTDLQKLRTTTGMVFQAFDLYPHMNILTNVSLAPRLVLKMSREKAQERAAELLRQVGMLDHAKKYPSQLSGGQQQRVAIARALANKPAVMLFDEPTSALDPEMINEVLDVMTTLAEHKTTMIVVTHELGFARRVGDRVVFMDAGRIVDDLPKEEFFGRGASERARDFLSKVLQH
ncbi:MULTISPECIES: amino acid ABC transporter ATP-binding protein [unclassified Bradyrhizobium]|uniref:amino acid ABC transporter ATP-binding protein n=1 Tax=unclassified Bradyrhizobium TaxID=2631580 RepID=UPI001FF808ED|nr:MULTISPECIES: amino acid ABC transporter ATP-binding protein [unclassified Bradyrhizobium]MCK1614041.1 amino acid ABC transporter ATP-binding protein [Bradyrhizobium sp. 163]MCK1767394.1 amino acid ABC transporter ATP-binding protein [Bradyrhizobium sp. 136]